MISFVLSAFSFKFNSSNKSIAIYTALEVFYIRSIDLSHFQTICNSVVYLSIFTQIFPKNYNHH